ncbi:MAG: GAF domain-containing protein [Anaerolineae bacterium]
MPLHNRGQVVSVLNIETYSGNTLTKDDFDLITAVGLDVELAIEQARLYTALRESNEKYQLVVNNVREVIFRCTDGYLTLLNNVTGKDSLVIR